MKKLLLMLVALIAVMTASAQTRTVAGTVLGAADDEPLIGATVAPQGGGMPVATDIDGKFTLTVPDGVKTIRVSYVGMVAQDVTLKDGDNNNLVIRLQDGDNKLDEVIVVAYGTATRSAYTGSAGIVKADVLETSLVSDATSALSGKVAGVQTLNSNGQPGVAPKVRVRGVGSINAGSEPLYVVDGIPFDGDIASINTMDIESMTVLKDAASAALYGARGANGVILITTKGGREGKAKVSVDARWGSNSRALPNYDVIESAEQYAELAYRTLYNSAYYNQNMTAADAHSYANAMVPSALGYKVFDTHGGDLILPGGKFNPAATRGWSDGRNYYTPDNWADGTIRSGLRQEYNVSVSGGTDKFNYYVSGAYLNDEGLIEGSHFNRLSTRASMDYQLRPWLKLGTNLSYAYTNSGYPGEQDTDASASTGNAFYIANSIAPYYPMYVRNADGQIAYNTMYNRPIYDYGDGKQTASKRNFMSMSNPAGDLLYNTEDYLSDVFNGKWFAVVTPFEGFTATGTVGYFVDNTRLHFLKNSLYGQSAASGGEAEQVYSRVRSINLQGLLNYRRTIADKHEIDVLLGYESYDYNYETGYGYGSNLYMPGSWVVSNTIDNRNAGGEVKTYATRGLFGRVNYTYDNRIFGSVSYRRDASSRFAPGHRWGNFWSMSAAWDVAKEQFAQDWEWLDMGKVKASFGQQGNDNLLYASGAANFYPWQDQYQVTGGNGVWSDGTLYYKGNPEITWETSNNFNIGVELSFWQGKLAGSVEYFSRQTSDMLYDKPVAPSNGYTSVPMNIGSMRNSGVEIDVNYRVIKTRDITWELNGNLTFVKNKVLKLHPDLNGEFINGTRIITEGESMYRLYLVDYAGVDPTTGLAL
ncbi:MAG: SusC/RagA family TonB-linked outer membrane protein, partial [Muribaculaceae bacterium]|nr:SusC/RagA family TonB-linked outer membrane protein [Muribaculaceae bacterium]